MTRCWTCNTAYDTAGRCPRCYELGERRRIQEESDQRRATELEEQNELMQELAEAEERRQDELLQFMRERAEEESERREAELERQREEWEAETERRREDQEELLNQQRDIAANRWRMQAESKRGRGFQLFQAGMPDDALKTLQEAAAEDPGNLHTWKSLWLVYSHLGDDVRKREAILKQIKLLGLPEHRSIAVYASVLNTIPSADTECLELFRERLNSRAALGSGDGLPDWEQMAEMFQEVGDAAGWNSAVRNQIRLLGRAAKLADFISVLNQIPNTEQQLMDGFRQVFSDSHSRISIKLVDTPDLQSLLARGLGEDVIGLVWRVACRDQTLSAHAAHIWAQAAAGYGPSDDGLVAYLNQCSIEQRNAILTDFMNVSTHLAAMQSDLEKNAQVQQCVRRAVSCRYVQWWPAVQAELRQQALKKIDVARLATNATRWAIAGAGIAFFGALVVAPGGYKLTAVIAAPLPCYFVIRELVRDSSVEECTLPIFDRLKNDELQRWADILELETRSSLAASRYLTPTFPSRYAKIGVAAAGVAVMMFHFAGLSLTSSAIPAQIRRTQLAQNEKQVSEWEMSGHILRILDIGVPNAYGIRLGYCEAGFSAVAPVKVLRIGQELVSESPVTMLNGEYVDATASADRSRLSGPMRIRFSADNTLIVNVPGMENLTLRKGGPGTPYGCSDIR